MFKFQKPKLFFRLEFDIWNIRIYFEFLISCFEFGVPCGGDRLEEAIQLVYASEAQQESASLSPDKGIVSPLMLNGRGGRGSIVMTREDHRFSG